MGELVAVDTTDRRPEPVRDGWGTGTDPHHVFPTIWGGPVVCPVHWMRWVCRSCHAQVHDPRREHEMQSRELLVPRPRPTR